MVILRVVPEAVSLANMQTENRLKIRQPDRLQQFVWAETPPIADFTPNVLTPDT